MAGNSSKKVSCFNWFVQAGRGVALVLELGKKDILEEEAIERVRCAMAGRPTNFVPSTRVQGAAEAWRRVQVRQLWAEIRGDKAVKRKAALTMAGGKYQERLKRPWRMFRW